MEEVNLLEVANSTGMVGVLVVILIVLWREYKILRVMYDTEIKGLASQVSYLREEFARLKALIEYAGIPQSGSDDGSAK